jgi:predicted amidophosphoribosyltransferase
MADRFVKFLLMSDTSVEERICSQCAKKIKPIMGFICEDCLSDDPEGRAMAGMESIGGGG